MKVYTAFDFWWKQSNGQLTPTMALATWKQYLSKKDTDSWIKYFEAYEQAGSPEVPMSTGDMLKVNDIYFQMLKQESEQPKRKVRILNA